MIKKYLTTLHERPHAHRKRFALAVAGGFTLIVFAIWSSVTFTQKPEVAKVTTGPVDLAATSQPSTSGLANVFTGISQVWSSITK